MSNKLIVISVLAYSIISVNRAFAQHSCSFDNLTLVPSSSVCCCVLDTSTSATNDYTCTVKSSCLINETPAGMKGKENEKVCPCSLIFN